VIREAGDTLGIPTGIKTLDTYWGGLQGGRVYLALGRPGDAKSFTLGKFLASGFLDGRRGGMFSPEMNEDEHRARIATLLSADPRVQEELGLKKAFRNRALMDGTGFNYKTYKRLWEWVNQQDGEMLLFTQKYRMQKMTPGYIAAKINDLGLDFLIVDPIYKLRPSSKTRWMVNHERLAMITDELCDVAEGHNIPLVMSNQAHRQMGNRGDAPTKDNSFGADAPVQEADYVFGVKHVKDERKLIIRCTKSRWCDEFRVDVKFLPNIGVMDDVSYTNKDFYNGHEDGSSDLVKKAVEEIEKEAGYDRV
jgi:replicative DNA helicase